MSHRVYFTRAKEEGNLWIERKKEDKQSLSGEEARDFYQSLLQETDGEKPKEGVTATTRRVRRRAGTVMITAHNLNAVLHGLKLSSSIQFFNIDRTDTLI